MPQRRVMLPRTKKDRRHTVRIRDYVTSVSLEGAFWAALCEIAQERNISLNRLVTEIDDVRRDNPESANLSSACRLYVLAYYQNVRAAKVA